MGGSVLEKCAADNEAMKAAVIYKPNHMPTLAFRLLMLIESILLRDIENPCLCLVLRNCDAL